MKGIKESIMTLDLTYTEGRYRFPYSWNEYEGDSREVQER
jgi:hypothetical protein